MILNFVYRLCRCYFYLFIQIYKLIMHLKKFISVAIICILLIAIIAVIFYNSQNQSDDGSNNINMNVVAIEDYDVRDADVGSCVFGSVIVQKTHDELTIRVLGQINVGKDDFGGVCFYFEKDMRLSSIVTSYRDELDADSVMIERIPGDSPFIGGSSVSFGRTPHLPGSGAFEIVYKYSGIQPIEDIDHLSISVSVGSYYLDDVPVVGHVSETLEIGLR